MKGPIGSTALRPLVAVLLLAVLVAAAARVALSARLERADVVFNNGAEVTTLDPATVTGVPEGRVMYCIFEGLCVKDPRTVEPLPGMAESWEISADLRTYTFHMRPGARWTNGDPVTAHDFAWSWERLLNPETAAEYAYQLWYVEGARAYSTEVGADGKPLHGFDTVGIRALDEHTLEVRLDAPTPFFLSLTSFYPLFPVNRRNIEEAQERWPDSWSIQWLRPENLVTNGAYRVLERRVNDRIRLAKNEGYWDADEVAMRTIDVLAVESYQTMLNLYLTGEVDWIDRVATSVVPRMVPRDDFDPAPYFGSYFYRVNVTRPPLDDVRVRRALALTIDRAAIADKVMKAGEYPAYALVPPVLDGYRNADLAHAPYSLGGEGGAPAYATAFATDADEARALLVEAGYGPGGAPFPTLEIHYNTSEAHRDIAEVIADGWKRELGIPCSLLNQEWKVYLDTQRNLDYAVSRSAWIGDYSDPNTFLDLFVTGGENNKTGWGNPAYDALIEAARTEGDAAARLEILRRAEELLTAELPVLPIYYYVTKNVVNPRLGGFYENYRDDHLPKFWYWKSDAELAQARELLPAGAVPAPAPGPPEGQYSPAELRRRGGS